MIDMQILPTPSFVDVLNVTFNNSPITPAPIQDISSTVPLWARLLTLICMILIDTCAFFGNLLVICAFLRTRRLQTVTNYFIASLAFADALVALFVLPLSIYQYQRNRLWKLGLILCDLWVSSDVLLCTSSILNLTCISVDRYMAITRPLTYTAYRSKFLARIMIFLVWIFSVVITCPPIFGWRDPNRREAVENGHQCDLNTARGYVVYSALGSFYIPAVVMIFVYIRIFMVVYDRENLIKKFHDTNPQTSTLPTTKSHQNGLENHRMLTDIHNGSVNASKDSNSKSSCNCGLFSSCLRPKSGQNLNRSSSANHTHSNICDNLDPTEHIQPMNRHGNVSMAITKKLNENPISRPCTLPIKKNINLAEEISRYRRQYFLSGRASEYRFRTGDSPCYQRKTFVNVSSSVNPTRSQSLEQVPMMSDTENRRRPLSMTNVINSGLSRQAIHSPPQEDEEYMDSDKNDFNQQAPNEQLNNTVCRSSETSDDIVPLYAADEANSTNTFAKRSPTMLTCSSSIGEQIYSNSVSQRERQSMSEKIRSTSNAKKKARATKSSPSTVLIENIRQQYNATGGNASMKSTISSTSMRRLHEAISLSPSTKSQKTSSCCHVCFRCLKPLNSWYERKRKNLDRATPNHSVTFDDDDDEKISSNEVSNRGPILVPSSYSLKTIEATNILPKDPSTHCANNILSNLSTPNTTHDVHRRERIRFLKEQKTAKTLAVVVGGFVLFWLPFFIMYVIPPEVYVFNPQTAVLITWLGYCNSVINPFIYAYCSKQFRTAFWNLTFGAFIKTGKPLSPVSATNNQINRRHLKN